MSIVRVQHAIKTAALVASLSAPATVAADKELLDILLGNGVITAEQHARLIKKDEISTVDILPSSLTEAPLVVAVNEEEIVTEVSLDESMQMAINDAVDKAISEASPIKASYGSKGFGFATRDGKFATNLQWRAQFRYSNPFGSDPRQLSAFNDDSVSSFEQRRLRMKIGGHGFQPWIKYYFEVDLQPARDVDADAVSLRRSRYRLASRSG